MEPTSLPLPAVLWAPVPGLFVLPGWVRDMQSGLQPVLMRASGTGGGLPACFWLSHWCSLQLGLCCSLQPLGVSGLMWALVILVKTVLLLWCKYKDVFRFSIGLYVVSMENFYKNVNFIRYKCLFQSSSCPNFQMQIYSVHIVTCAFVWVSLHILY